VPYHKVEGLTAPQAEALKYLVEHIERYGYQPSMGEMGEALGGITVAAIRDRIIQLAQKGYVEFTGKKRERALRIVNVTFKAVVGGGGEEADQSHTPDPLGQKGDVIRAAIIEVLAGADGPMSVADLAGAIGEPVSVLYKAMGNAPKGLVKTGTKWGLAGSADQQEGEHDQT